MTRTTAGGRRWARGVVALAAVAAMVPSVSGCGAPGGGGKHYAAMLSTAIGVYPAADVRVLGVAVGKVDAVTPQGELVRVDFHVDGDVTVPAEAKAAVVAPTVVADRYLQLAPPYTGGPVMPEGTVIPRERTASPAEFDDLLAAAQKLSRSLGPGGVNADGALSQALTTLARNLSGNGQQLNTTLDNTAQAANTLSASRDNLANTVRGLQSFTTNLARDDAAVRAFVQQFAEVNRFLVGERKDLGDTLRELSLALGDVAAFVHDNRSGVRENVRQLSDVLETVNNERLALEQFLETAPTGLDGLVNAYDSSVASVATRSDLLGQVFCLLSSQLRPTPLGTAFDMAVDSAFPGALAACAGNGLLASAADKIKLSPRTLAALSDPKLLAGLSALAERRAGAGAPPPAAPPVPAAPRLPVVGPVPADEEKEPPAPRAPARTLGELLGGGR